MKRITTLILLLAGFAFCKDHKPASSSYVTRYTSSVPLGAERIDLHPSKRSMYILATAESSQFDGWHTPQDSHVMFKADGSKVERYPQHIDVRLTATAMRPNLLMIDPYGTLRLTDEDINDYLLNLHFRMLIFHGLDVTPIEPNTVDLIGMPADVNYDERIFQLRFEMPRQVSINDRIVIEVLSPTQNRLCKFHLDLF